MWHNATSVYTASGSRELDRQAMAIDGLAAGELMQQAGEAAYRLLRYRWPHARVVTIVCGPGNNGGDGYVLARLCHERGLQPVVIYAGELERQSGDALAARQQYQQTTAPMIAYDGESLPAGDVIVDALLGSGSDRLLAGQFLQLVNAMNAAAAPVLALDLPSGVSADSGGLLGAAVKADASLCFIGLKQGLLSGPALNVVGELFFSELGLSKAALSNVGAAASLIDEAQVRHWLPGRQPDTHKGRQGRLLVVGGNAGMTGAVCLAGEAALRTGAGLVTLVLPSATGTKTPAELMTTIRQHRREMSDSIQAADVVVIGPGLGSDQWAQEMYAAVTDQRKNVGLLIDAEGLTQLAMNSMPLPGAVLTPHPGEAARLLGCDTRDVQQDRYTAARAIATQYECVCVLKGAGTLVSDGEAMFVCDRGHPGMATAGAGDVLSGVIAALMGQGVSPLHAACAGVWLHAVAGERAASHSGNGLIASDISEQLPGILQSVSP